MLNKGHNQYPKNYENLSLTQPSLAVLCRWHGYVASPIFNSVVNQGMESSPSDSKRNRLKQVGLINFTSSRGEKRPAKYYLNGIIDALIDVETHNNRNNKVHNKVHNKRDNNRNNNRKSHIIYREDKDKDIDIDTSTDVDVVDKGRRRRRQYVKIFMHHWSRRRLCRIQALKNRKCRLHS